MKRTLKLAVVVVAAAASAMVGAPHASAQPTAADEVGVLIVGGGPATQTYPFMASLQPTPGSHLCGAALIAPRWLLTAAHCVVYPSYFAQVRVGTTNRTQGGSVYTPTQVVVHPKYRQPPDVRGVGHDIALVKISQQAVEAPVALATGAQVGDAVRLMGWGLTGSGPTPIGLKQLDGNIVAPTRCQPATMIEGNWCAGWPPGSGSCSGDSGSPIVANVAGTWRLIGILSRGNCGTGTTSVLANAVQDSDWIKSHIGTGTPTG